MAPVYDFRHVELDKIGRGKRIVKPPGGECSDIFGSPFMDHVTPRKAHRLQMHSMHHSDIFSSAQHPPPTSPPKALDTQDRLFGCSPHPQLTPRRAVVNRQRSSIFEDEVTDSRPRSTPARRSNPMNPITGEVVCENGAASPTSNGHANGHLSPEGSFRVRNPPGGKSSGIF